MTQYHAVMLDETRCEFGVSVTARSRAEAYEKLAEDYPESKCVQLESPADRRAREQDLYDRLEREENGDFREWEYEQGY